MNKKANSRGNLYFYLKWPLIAILYMIFVTIVIYAMDIRTGTIMLAFLVPFVIFGLYLYLYKYNFLEPAIEKAVEKETKKHIEYFTKIDVPHAVLSIEGRILWANDAFLNIASNVRVGQNVAETFSDLNKTIFDNIKDEKINLLTACGDKKYKVELRKLEQNYDNNAKVIMLYLYDQTDFYDLKQKYDNDKQVSGYIYIDNFDEVAENMEDSKASMLMAMVDRKLTRYISYNSGILKKLEKDKYFFVTTKKDIEDMIDDRFTILEQTKEIMSEDNMPLTLSVGIGYEGKSIETNHELARIAMDMALGRGGDQVVVKKGQETLFFGGKSGSSISNIRVRSRVKASSFRETLDTKDKVLIMGHNNGDLDSFGASIGTYIMAKHIGKDVHIVVNSLTKDALEMKNKYKESDSYDQNMFITGDESIAFADDNTLLILVDHNQPKISDEPRLHDKGLDYVVFDHHRLQANSFSDAILTYIDPSASSTSEIVTEIMIYFDDRLKIRQLDADTLLGGILVDTMSFTYQTGAKTFETASFLKKKGADGDRVRKLLRLDSRSAKIKNEVINASEIYNGGYAIAILSDTSNIDSSVVKAEIANELIDIKGVKASIVLTYDDKNNKYAISSRSIDEVNVQVLMEKLGGGGHRSQAGASIEAESFDDAISKVKNAIDSMHSEGK